MKKIIQIVLVIITINGSIDAQYFYGVKGGMGINMQQWNSFERDILFTPLIDVFMESHDDQVNKLYGSIGFHTRGSAIRGFGFQAFQSYKFHNISLELGFKQMLSVTKKYKPYYMLAGRLEYTVATNLGGREQFSVFNLVDDNFVNRWNYGLTIGGGFEYKWDATKVVFVEASINPDASRQYDQPSSVKITNPNPSPFNPSTTITIMPQQVRNISIELKVGIKFLQDYYEEGEEY